jgi:hypothetical protein
MTKTPLQRLEAEFGDVWIVLALGCFNQLRTDETAKIERVWHLEFLPLVLPGSPASPYPALHAR